MGHSVPSNTLVWGILRNAPGERLEDTLSRHFLEELMWNLMVGYDTLLRDTSKTLVQAARHSGGAFLETLL